MTSVNVRYSRDVGSHTIEGSVRLVVDPGADWQGEWGFAYAQLKNQVDQAADAINPTPVHEHTAPEGQRDSTDRSSVPSDPSDATTEVSQAAPTFQVGAPVQYTGCRVMYPANDYAATNTRREHVRMRIGNKDQIPYGTPQGYVNAKSYEAEMMKTLRLLRPGDIVDISGSFEEPWTKRNKDGSTSTEYDLVVDSITRV